MKILLTGGAGFIGSHLGDRLIELGHQVVVLDNLSTGKRENLNKKVKFYKLDILSPKVSQIFKKEKPEIVFHFAAQIEVRKSVENPRESAKVNLLGSLNLLENCKKFKVKKFIFASTGAIYGEAKKIPTSETEPENPQSPYGLEKLIVEKYLKFYRNLYNLDYVSLRYSNVYGPRQNSKEGAGVVAIFIDKLFQNLPPTISGSGQQTRDFIYIDDAIEATIKALNSKGLTSASFEPIFNVGTGIETSINQLYELISEVLTKRIKPIFAPAKAGDLKRSCLDPSKIKKELGWQPRYDLKEGLEKTISWFKQFPAP